MQGGGTAVNRPALLVPPASALSSRFSKRDRWQALRASGTQAMLQQVAGSKGETALASATGKPAPRTSRRQGMRPADSPGKHPPEALPLFFRQRLACDAVQRESHACPEAAGFLQAAGKRPRLPMRRLP